MANQYSPVIVLDTTNADLDLASLAFGDSNAVVHITKVIMANPTASDKFILKDVNGDIVVEMYAKITAQDEQRDFVRPIRVVGLKMLTADVVRTTGKFIVYVE